MYKRSLKELEEEYAKELKERAKELQEFPLSAYSTTQLKAELRRRKNEGIK